ncbi:MAG: LIC_13387 family protein [Phycisphaerae bacterium]
MLRRPRLHLRQAHANRFTYVFSCGGRYDDPFGVGHFFGFLSAAHAARNDPRLAELTEAMRAQRTRVLGFSPSILDFREYFSLNFSLLLLLGAGLNVIALRNAANATRAVRELSIASAVAMALLVVTSAVFAVPQGIISAGVIFLLFAAACL